MKHTLIALVSLLFIFNSCSKSATESTPSTEPIRTTTMGGDFFEGTFYYVPASVSYSNGIFYFSGNNTTPASGTYPACNGYFQIILKVHARDTGMYKLYSANYITVTETGFCTQTISYTTDTNNMGSVTITKFDTLKKIASGTFYGVHSSGAFTNLTW